MDPTQHRSGSPASRSPVRGLEEPRAGGGPSDPPPHPRGNGSLSGAITPVLSAAAVRAAGRVVKARRPSLLRILRGALAGAGAAGVVYALRRLTDDPPGLELTDELMAGAGRGVVYASVLEPWIPGPAVMRGAMVGTLDYLLVPWGGIFAPLQELTPTGRIPVVKALLETGDAEDDPYLAFLAYGVALALLQGSDQSED